MTANLKLTANNLQLLNVKKNEESLVYGKLFVNLNSTVRGPLDALTMRGDLQLLGGTNITYVLKDSPLTVQDRMSDMVTFTSFTDTLRRRMPRKPPLPMGGMDMLMTIHIDPAVQAKRGFKSRPVQPYQFGRWRRPFLPVYPARRYVLERTLHADGRNHQVLHPGHPAEGVQRTGGSYVQWTGNPMDPTLNLTATERVRTSVTLTGQSSPRLVNFDVRHRTDPTTGEPRVAIYPHAPGRHGDARGTNLERSGGTGEAAVSMLVTGMYLGGGGGGGKVNMNMGDALTSFLQSEINNIAGSALKSVDISFGMETYDDNGDAGGRYPSPILLPLRQAIL